VRGLDRSSDGTIAGYRSRRGRSAPLRPRGRLRVPAALLRGAAKSA